MNTLLSSLPLSFSLLEYMYSRKISENSRTNLTLRKHAYSNILKILQPKKKKKKKKKKENFLIKNSDILHISAQNIDCGYS